MQRLCDNGTLNELVCLLQREQEKKSLFLSQHIQQLEAHSQQGLTTALHCFRIFSALALSAPFPHFTFIFSTTNLMCVYIGKETSEIG